MSQPFLWIGNGKPMTYNGKAIYAPDPTAQQVEITAFRGVSGYCIGDAVSGVISTIEAHGKEASSSSGLAVKRVESLFPRDPEVSSGFFEPLSVITIPTGEQAGYFSPVSHSIVNFFTAFPSIVPFMSSRSIGFTTGWSSVHFQQPVFIGSDYGLQPLDDKLFVDFKNTSNMTLDVGVRFRGNTIVHRLTPNDDQKIIDEDTTSLYGDVTGLRVPLINLDISISITPLSS